MKKIGKDGWINYAETPSIYEPGPFAPEFAGMGFPFMTFSDGRTRDVHEVIRLSLWPSGLATWQDGYKVVKTVRP